MGSEPAHAVIDRYVRAAKRFGALSALLIPALPELATIPDMIARLDAIMLTGSLTNLHPRHYGADGDGEAPHDHARDETAMRIVESAVALGRPVFGICRGFQELNAALGGTLRTGLAAPDRRIAHHAPADVPFEAMFEHHHPVALVEGGVLRRRLGASEIVVNSVHFQGIDRVAPGLNVEAVAPDGVVEALSGSPGGTPVLGVQWHPEWRAESNPAAQAFFRLLGETARGDHSAFGEPA